MACAGELLRSGRLAQAREQLAREPADPRTLYLLSLLYRYDDDYARERAVITRALAMDGGNAYMRGRQAWYDLPSFGRVVPRRPLILPRDPDKTPEPETLDQLCIVTAGGSDEPFRQLLIELLESLEATRLYRDAPVYIIDSGLTDQDRHFLMVRFPQIRSIRDPGWDVDTGGMSLGYKATTARVFMNRHFPGHRFYLWIDTDCWVQDELALDELLSLARSQGIGICPDAVPSRMLYATFPAPPGFMDAGFLRAPPGTDALFCIDAAGPTFDDLQRVFLELHRHSGFTHFIGQFAMNVILRRDGREAVQADAQRVLLNVSINELSGCPLVDEDDRILNLRGEIAGVPHLTWNTKFLSPYRRPFIRSTSSSISLAYANHVEGLFWNDALPASEDIRYTSLCYRTWPWADKPLLRALLTETIVDPDAPRGWPLVV